MRRAGHIGSARGAVERAGSRGRSVALAVVLGVALGASASWAQPEQGVTIDARRCMEIESPAERLACFEAQVDAAASPAAERAAQPPRASGEPATAAPAPARSRAAAEEPAEREWVGTITALRLREPNQYVVTLDTGQVWHQRYPERYALRVGQRVRVYESRWGAHHRLQADGLNGFIQVERVQ